MPELPLAMGVGGLRSLSTATLRGARKEGAQDTWSAWCSNLLVPGAGLCSCPPSFAHLSIYTSQVHRPECAWLSALAWGAPPAHKAGPSRPQPTLVGALGVGRPAIALSSTLCLSECAAGSLRHSLASARTFVILYPPNPTAKSVKRAFGRLPPPPFAALLPCYPPLPPLH